MFLFDLVNVIIEMAMLLFYCHSIFETKMSMNYIVKVMLILALIGFSTLTGMLRLPTAMNLIISYCTFFIISYCLYKGTLRNKVFMGAIWIVSVYIADIFATIIITFFGIEYSMAGGDDITYIIGATLSNFIRLWLLAYAGKILSRRIRELPVSYWIFLFVCPVLSVMCLIIFDIYLMQAQTVNRLLVFIPSFCILYINFMLFRFFETFSDRIRLKVVEELAQSKEENYKILQANEEELHKLRHDIKNHILMLNEYLEHDDAQTALNHLKNIQTTLDNISATVSTNNPAIDAAINIGAKKARAENVEYKVQIIGNARVNMEAADICSFLSNAIDNAIEACAICEKKFVYVELHLMGEGMKIHIENTTVAKPETFTFFTTKTDRRSHGFGMKNMQDVAKKYNGVITHSITDGVFILDTFLCNFANL